MNRKSNDFLGRGNQNAIQKEINESNHNNIERKISVRCTSGCFGFWISTDTNDAPLFFS